MVNLVKYMCVDPVTAIAVGSLAAGVFSGISSANQQKGIADQQLEEARRRRAEEQELLRRAEANRPTVQRSDEAAERRRASLNRLRFGMASTLTSGQTSAVSGSTLLGG